jgi:hypothetical protein
MLGDATVQHQQQQPDLSRHATVDLKPLKLGCCYWSLMTTQVYTEIKDQSAMTRVVNDYLADFNATSKKPMHLVIFQVRRFWFI